MPAKYGLTSSTGVPSGASALERTAGFPRKGLITAPISMVQGITDYGTMVIQVLAHRMDRSGYQFEVYRIYVTFDLNAGSNDMSLCSDEGARDPVW